MAVNHSLAVIGRGRMGKMELVFALGILRLLMPDEKGVQVQRVNEG